MYIVPFFHSAAALAVAGKHSTVEPDPQLSAVTVVLAAFAVSVNVPTAFESSLAQLPHGEDDLRGIPLGLRDDRDAHLVPSRAKAGSTPVANVQAVPDGMRMRPRARRVETLATHRPLALTACSAE